MSHCPDTRQFGGRVKAVLFQIGKYIVIAALNTLVVTTYSIVVSENIKKQLVKKYKHCIYAISRHLHLKLGFLHLLMILILNKSKKIL